MWRCGGRDRYVGVSEPTGWFIFNAVGPINYYRTVIQLNQPQGPSNIGFDNVSIDNTLIATYFVPRGVNQLPLRIRKKIGFMILKCYI